MSMPYRWLLLTAACLSVSTLATADDTVEPPLTYTLEINGKQHTLTADTPVVLKGNFRNPKVTLRASSTRRFHQADIAFDYPANFTFEADVSEPGMRNWTMSGNDVTLMLFDFDEKVSPAEMIASTADSLNTDVDKMQRKSLQLGPLTAKGHSAALKVGEITLTQMVIDLPAQDGKSRLLVIQDLPNDDGTQSDEMTAIIKMLGKSFTRKP